MDKEAAYALIVEYLTKQFSVDKERIHPKAKLFEELDLDSIDALDMLALLDRKLKIAVNEKEAMKIRTVEDVVQYMVANLPADLPADLPAKTPES